MNYTRAPDRLQRSRKDHVIAGVCAGIADYLGVDTVLVRLVFALLFFSGVSILLYVALWIIMPEEPPVGDATLDRQLAEPQMIDADGRTPRARNQRFVVFAGTALIGWGMLLLLREFNVPGLGWVQGEVLMPLAVIAIGIALLLRKRPREE